MANKATPYLGLTYNETGDKNFRSQYILAMDKIDNDVVQYFVLDGRVNDTFNMRYPTSRANAIFDDGFISPAVDFKRVPKQTRYLRVGNKVFFEAQVTNDKPIEVNLTGDVTNTPIATIVGGEFKRRFGEGIFALSEVAARYSYSGDGNGVSLAAFGGMIAGTTIPAETKFSFGGWFTT